MDAAVQRLGDRVDVGLASGEPDQDVLFGRGQLTSSEIIVPEIGRGAVLFSRSLRARQLRGAADQQRGFQNGWAEVQQIAFEQVDAMFRIDWNEIQPDLMALGLKADRLALQPGLGMRGLDTGLFQLSGSLDAIADQLLLRLERHAPVEFAFAIEQHEQHIAGLRGAGFLGAGFLGARFFSRVGRHRASFSIRIGETREGGSPASRASLGWQVEVGLAMGGLGKKSGWESENRILALLLFNACE